MASGIQQVSERRNTVRNLFKAADSRYNQFLTFLQIAVPIFSLIAIIRYENATMGAIGIIGWIVLMAIWFPIIWYVFPFVRFFIDASHGMKISLAWDRQRFGHLPSDDYWPGGKSIGRSLVFLPALAFLLGCACCFNTPATNLVDFTDSPESGYVIWIVGHNHTTTKSALFAIPFLEEVNWVNVNQAEDITAVGVTKDGVHVSAILSPSIVLQTNNLSLDQLISKTHRPNPYIKVGLKKLFQQAFASYVATKPLAALKEGVVTDYQTGVKVTNFNLIPYGVKWDGQFSLSKLHAYFN